jgi:hypothetical protein
MYLEKSIEIFKKNLVLTVEGLFRISGSAADVKKLRAEIDSGNLLNFHRKKFLPL